MALLLGLLWLLLLPLLLVLGRQIWAQLFVLALDVQAQAQAQARAAVAARVLALASLLA